MDDIKKEIDSKLESKLCSELIYTGLESELGYKVRSEFYSELRPEFTIELPITISQMIYNG